MAVPLRYFPPSTSLDTPPPPPPPPPPPLDLKEALIGIGPRVAYIPSELIGAPGMAVADVKWSAIQPLEGGPIATGSTGPGSWAQITTARANGTPYRLRVHCGDDAPEWVKSYGGAPLAIVRTESKPAVGSDPGYEADGKTVFNVPRWWTTPFLTAWGDLMRKLAAILESDPLCREVASHPATTHYAEPFQRGTKPLANSITGHPNFGKTNVQIFYEAMLQTDSRPGYAQVQMSGSTVVGPAKLDQAAILWPFELITVGGQQLTRWESFGWKTTRYYLPFNPFQQWRVTGTSPFTYAVTPDPGGWTDTSMGLIGGTMGDRLVIGNNSLRAPTRQAGPGYPKLFQDANVKPNRNGFQTATQDLLTTQYRDAMGNQSLTPKQALQATIGIGVGTIHNQGTGNDPNNLVDPPITRLRAQSIELPPGWDNHLTRADVEAWNAVCQANANAYPGA